MKKKMVQNLKWATTHLSRRLGAGLGARHSDTARRCAGEARGKQARRRRHGRAGARALGRWERRASGRAGHARQADAGQARGRRARAAGARHGRAVGRHAGRGRRVGHGRLGGLGGAWACSWANGLCTWCTQPILTLFDSVFFLSH